MREFPVFVPSRGERIGAVIAVPEEDPRGLVLLMPGGGGAPRSHRYAMYTKVARALAGRGIASVRMDWRGVGDSTGRARFSFHALPVEDDGPGIPEPFVSHMFDPFARGPDVGDKVGSGLGLTIVRQLLEALGGSVWYEPGVPSGACFKVGLRRAS